MRNDFKEVFNLINNSKKICIAGHKSPDGDCIGSVMALYNFLKAMDKDLTVLLDGEIPFNFKAFVNEEVIAEKYQEEFDLMFILDCSDSKRLGKYEPAMKQANKTVVIDHHKTNEGFGDINIIDAEMSSTGELLYNLLKSSGMTLSKEIAQFIYIAILTDTGKFSYSSTTSKTHIIAADLINLGVNIAEIDNIVYNSKPANVMKAFIDCISSMELYYGNKFSLTSITKDILDKNKVKMGDVDGVAEFLRGINEVEVSCVLKEEDEFTKVSLRSKNKLDVSSISAKFGGGGHAKAAGFEIKDNVENIKKLLLKELKEYFK